MEFSWADLARLLAACVAGAVIGFERELHDKPAGLRTNLLICLGAALFTLLSIKIADGFRYDPGRIAAQIVTGVGFLGAGTIVQQRGGVVGLTTAATIWLVASVGMAFGAGAFALGTLVTALTTAVLFGFQILEDRIARWRTTAKFHLEMTENARLSEALLPLLRELALQRKTWKLSKTPEGFAGFLEVVGPEDQVERLQDRLMSATGVTSLLRL